MKMKLLALDTATEACSAALYLDGEVYERYQLAPREHNRLILPMIDALLSEAGLKLGQLDALAFGRGPGSFTGVRIAAGVAQGLAFGASLPVVPVSTLAALAQEAFEETLSDHAFPCIDARMGEVYWGVYRRGGDGLAQSFTDEAVLPPLCVSASASVSAGLGIGSGWHTYRDLLTQRLGAERIVDVLEDRFPRAGCIARLAAALYAQGACVAPDQAQPVYLRDKVANKPNDG